MAEPRRLTF